jgi:hypothetical protein
LLDIPNEQPTPDPGTAGLNKGSGGGSKPKPERAAGGGGGGREEQKPASFGKVPQASLDVPQVVAPDPKPPQIKNPSLPVAATVVADPMLVPPDARVLPYGDYKSKSTDPSSGPGTGNGIGLDKVEVSAPVKAVDSDLVAGETWAAVTSTPAVADLVAAAVATTVSSLVRM